VAGKPTRPTESNGTENDGKNLICGRRENNGNCTWQARTVPYGLGSILEKWQISYDQLKSASRWWPRVKFPVSVGAFQRALRHTATRVPPLLNTGQTDKNFICGESHADYGPLRRRPHRPNARRRLNKRWISLYCTERSFFSKLLLRVLLKSSYRPTANQSVMLLTVILQYCTVPIHWKPDLPATRSHTREADYIPRRANRQHTVDAGVTKRR